MPGDATPHTIPGATAKRYVRPRDAIADDPRPALSPYGSEGRCSIGGKIIRYTSGTTEPEKWPSLAANVES
jgi:hypothetical protein